MDKPSEHLPPDDEIDREFTDEQLKALEGADEFWGLARKVCNRKDVSAIIRFMIKRLTNAGLDLIDIKLDEDMVKEVLRSGHLASSKDLWERAKNAKNLHDIKIAVSKIEEQLAAIGKERADIGATDEAVLALLSKH